MIRPRRLLRITTQDDHLVEVDYEDLRLSELIKTIVGTQEENEGPIEFPLPNVDKDILEEIIEFGKHYRTQPLPKIHKPLPPIDFKDVIDDWYYRYICDFEVVHGLYPLLKAVNYMDIQPIQDLACARIASLIRGKEPSEIKRILGIE